MGSVFLTVGMIGFLAAAGLVLLELGSARRSSADGIVIGFSYGPVVEFTAQDGTTARFASPVRSSFWHVGDHVRVAYAPEKTSDAAIDGFTGRWFLPSLFGFLAGVFLLTGGGLTFAGRRRAR
ncbi:MAG: DUF3592 domain-containing protein [Hyphomicrobiales bacterium]